MTDAGNLTFFLLYNHYDKPRRMSATLFCRTYLHKRQIWTHRSKLHCSIIFQSSFDVHKPISIYLLFVLLLMAFLLLIKNKKLSTDNFYQKKNWDTLHYKILFQWNFLVYAFLPLNSYFFGIRPPVCLHNSL